MKVLVSLVLLFAAFIAPAHAAAPAPGIVTVDIQRVLRDSTATQSIRKQLDAKRNTYQADIKKDEDRLRSEDQQFAKDRQTLSKEALIDKQKSLRQDFGNVERKVMARRQVLDKAFADAMKQVREALAKIVIDSAKAQGANIVLSKQETMWIAPELEITDSVISQLNQKLPSVNVSFSAPQDSTGK